jgi:hypothetical protein
MPWDSGTATDSDDLLDRLKTFLTGGALVNPSGTVMTAGQEWAILNDEIKVCDATNKPPDWATSTYGTDMREVYMEGPGLSATDEIHVNLMSYSIPATGGTADNWEIECADSYDSEQLFRAQPGCAHLNGQSTSYATYVCLSSDPFDYWFVGTGRYFYVAVAVSTTTTIFGGGFYLPYSLPSETPYPIFKLGTTRIETTRWSIANSTHLNFYNSGTYTDISMIRNLDGYWLDIDSENTSATTTVSLHPNDSYNTDAYSIIANQDDPRTYTLLPYVMYAAYSGNHVYGEYQNIYWISSYNQAAGNIITVGSDDYVVLQNIWKTDDNSDFCALKLE